jgi:hypothetical protein
MDLEPVWAIPVPTALVRGHGNDVDEARVVVGLKDFI